MGMVMGGNGNRNDSMGVRREWKQESHSRTPPTLCPSSVGLFCCCITGDSRHWSPYGLLTTPSSAIYEYNFLRTECIYVRSHDIINNHSIRI